MGLGALAAVGGLVASQWRYIQEARRGPETLSAAELGKAMEGNALSSRWVTLSDAKSYDTGVRRVLKLPGTKGGGKHLKYVLIPAGERFLLVEVAVEKSMKGSVTGFLKHWEDRKHSEVVAEVEGKAKAIRGKLWSLQLDAEEEPSNNLLWLWVSAAFLGVPALILLLCALFRKSNQPSGAMLQQQALYGQHQADEAKRSTRAVSEWLEQRD
jgi:hypothetical protein